MLLMVDLMIIERALYTSLDKYYAHVDKYLLALIFGVYFYDNLMVFHT